MIKGKQEEKEEESRRAQTEHKLKRAYGDLSTQLRSGDVSV